MGAFGGLMTLIMARNIFWWVGVQLVEEPFLSEAGWELAERQSWGRGTERWLGEGGGWPQGLWILNCVCGFRALITCQGNLEGQARLQPSPGMRSQVSGAGSSMSPPSPPTLEEVTLSATPSFGPLLCWSYFELGALRPAISQQNAFQMWLGKIRYAIHTLEEIRAVFCLFLILCVSSTNYSTAQVISPGDLCQVSPFLLTLASSPPPTFFLGNKFFSLVPGVPWCVTSFPMEWKVPVGKQGPWWVVFEPLCLVWLML